MRNYDVLTARGRSNNGKHLVASRMVLIGAKRQDVEAATT